MLPSRGARRDVNESGFAIGVRDVARRDLSQCSGRGLASTILPDREHAASDDKLDGNARARLESTFHLPPQLTLTSA